MASLSEIRQALADTIRNGVEMGISVYPRITMVGALPAVMIEPNMADFDHAFQRGSDEWDFNAFVLVSPSDYDSGQDQLDALIASGGPDSIRQAIYVASDLGLSGDVTAHVSGMRGYGGSFAWAGPEHIGAILKITVLADGRT